MLASGWKEIATREEQTMGACEHAINFLQRNDYNQFEYPTTGSDMHRRIFHRVFSGLYE
jgi:hypothetical protein